jgi:hypothetical protein
VVGPVLDVCRPGTRAQVTLRVCSAAAPVLSSACPVSSARALPESRMVDNLQGARCMHTYQICCHVVLSYSVPVLRRLPLRQYLTSPRSVQAPISAPCAYITKRPSPASGKTSSLLLPVSTPLPSLYQPPSTICILHILRPSPTHTHPSIPSSINQSTLPTTSRPSRPLTPPNSLCHLPAFPAISFEFYHLIQWLAQVEVLPGAATPSLAKVARRARDDTFAVMKHSRNGKPKHLPH